MNITINEAQAPPLVVQRGNGLQCFLAGMIAGLLLTLAVMIACAKADKDAAAKNASPGPPVMPDLDRGELRPSERIFELITADDKGNMHTREADFLPKLLGAAAERKSVLDGDAAPPLTPSGPGK